jgi:hypothetical protein
MGTKKGKETNIWELNLLKPFWGLVAPDVASLHLSRENHLLPLHPNCSDPKQTRSMCLYGLIKDTIECTIMYISLQIKKTGKKKNQRNIRKLIDYYLSNKPKPIENNEAKLIRNDEINHLIYILTLA